MCPFGCCSGGLPSIAGCSVLNLLFGHCSGRMVSIAGDLHAVEGNSLKNGLKIDEFRTHQIPPNLKFCLSRSKEMKILFVLK